MNAPARSSLPSRRLRALLTALTLLMIVTGACLPAGLALAQAGFRVEIRPSGTSLTAPGSDWVAAERISFSGCIDRGTFGDCFGRMDSTTGLYEQYPRRRSVGRQYEQNPPPAPGPVFSGLDRQPCIAGGIFQFWPAGVWHYGGRWTRTVSYQLTNRGSDVILVVTISWTPAGTHAWAFYPSDQCPTMPVYNATNTPVPPGFVPSPTPPGFVPSPTSTRPSGLPTPTTTSIIPTPVPTNPPCISSAIPPMPLTLYEGQIPFNGSNYNPPFTSYTGRYIGKFADRYYQESTHDAHLAEKELGVVAGLMPERNLWVRINPNRIVQATFDLLNTSFSPPGYPVTWRVFNQSDIMNARNLMIVLQDLGNDRQPGGGDDTLLAFIAAGDSPENGSTSPQRIRVASQRDGVYSTIPVQGRPDGFQAALRSGILTDFTGRIFTWAGRDQAPHNATRWPVAPIYQNGNLTVHARDWFWVPNGEQPTNLSLRFATEPNRVYRMLALIGAPVCKTQYNAVSVLVFHTLGDADMAITKTAPAEAVREMQIEYGLVARNVGATTAQNVVVTDTLPDGVAFVSSNPPPSRMNGRTLTWNLGNVDPNVTRSIAVVVNVVPNAPDTLTNVGEVRAENDSNLANNRAEATTSLVQTNVAVSMTATRVVRPGDEFQVTITYRNTSQTTARNVRLTYNRPFGAVMLSSSRVADASTTTGMVWQIGDLGAGSSGSITLRLRALRENEAAALPGAMEHVAIIGAAQDADPRDNEAQAITALLVFPQPDSDLRMRIHSEFDRNRVVYRTDGTAFAWPVGETLFFIPEVTLREPPIMSPPAYAARQRVVAWSFVGSGSLALNNASCKAREQPVAQETQHADLSRMQGCIYRYRTTVGPTEIIGQGRLYWAPFAPESLAAATYGIWPLPPGSTNIRVQYAVLTELVETGLYDIDGDGRGDSVLDRRTDVLDGTYIVTLVAPRDMR